MPDAGFQVRRWNFGLTTFHFHLCCSSVICLENIKNTAESIDNPSCDYPVCERKYGIFTETTQWSQWFGLPRYTTTFCRLIIGEIFTQIHDCTRWDSQLICVRQTIASHKTTLCTMHILDTGPCTHIWLCGVLWKWNNLYVNYCNAFPYLALGILNWRTYHKQFDAWNAKYSWRWLWRHKF